MLKRILDDKRLRLVSELQQKLGEVRVALVRAEASDEHQKALARATRQLDELFLLVVVGEFNAGKSAVINALVGDKVLEEGVTPTTSRVQLVRYGPEKTRSQAGGDYEEITLPVALLREMNVVDTPGTNAVVRGHEALTREFVPRSDLVLFVTSADRPFTESERTFLETIRDWGKKLVVAVNKVDILEKPGDVAKVVEFVRDKLRELLGLRPEVFPVSARQAAKSKAAGLGPDPSFGALEAYLTRTLDEAERLRVKLQSPLGVADKVLDATAKAVEARLAVVAEDEAALKEIDGLLLQQLQDLTRDFKLRQAEAERPIVELERRGAAFLDEKLTTGRALALLGASGTAAALRQELTAGLAASVDKRTDGVVDALVAAELRLWPAVVERLERRRAARGPRSPVARVTAPAPDRARAAQALGRESRRALEGFDAAGFGAGAGAAARRSAWLTLLAFLAAAAAVAVTALRAETTTGVAIGAAATLALVLAGLLPLPLARAGQKRQLAEAAAGLRQRLSASLRTGFERELDASQKRVQDATRPLAQLARGEGEKLRGQAYELQQRRKEMEALRTRVAGLR